MNTRTIRRFLAPSLTLAALAAPAAAHDPKWHPHETPLQAPNFGASVGVMGLWLPGQGAAIPPLMQIPTGSIGDYVNATDDHKSIADFERYSTTAGEYFALVYSPVERVELLVPEATNLVTNPPDPAGTWHLADFETFRLPAGRRWAGLYRSGVRNQDFVPELSGAALKTRVEETKQDDLEHHLVDFEVFVAANGMRYAALFDDQQKDQLFYPSLTAEDFHSRVHELHDSYRLADVEVWRTPEGSPRIAALFTETGSSDYLWALACTLECTKEAIVLEYYEELQDKAAKLATSSLRLADLELPLDQLVEPPSGLKPNATKAPEAPKAKREKGPRKHRPDRRVVTSVPPPVSPTHALLLHDAGTDGPP